MAITSSGYLQPSEASGAFGPGVYLTDLNPNEFFRDEILTNNYGCIRSEFHNRADCVVEVTERNIDMHFLRKVNVPGKTNRRIFVYPYFISVAPDQVYDKPRCLHYVSDEYDTEDSTSIDDIEDSQSESEAGSSESEDDEFGIGEHGTEYESGDESEDDLYKSGSDDSGSDYNEDSTSTDYTEYSQSESEAGSFESEDEEFGIDEHGIEYESGDKSGSYDSRSDYNEDGSDASNDDYYEENDDYYEEFDSYEDGGSYSEFGDD